MTDELIGSLGGPAGRLLPPGRARGDDPDRLGMRGPAAGRGLLPRGRPPRGAPAGPARPAGPGRVLPRARDRGPARPPLAGRPCSRPTWSTAGSGSRPRATPDRMARIDPARQAVVDRARDPIRKAAAREALGRDPVPDRRLRRRRRDAARASTRRTSPRRCSSTAPTRSPPGRTSAGGRRGWWSSWPRVQDGPDRGRRDRPDALGRRADLDQLRRPAQHALGRDLHRPGRGDRATAGSAAASPSAAAVASWSASSWSSTTGRVVSARAEEGEDVPAARCSTSTPAPAGSGELGPGPEPGIDRFTGSILYDEKIGGHGPPGARPELPRDRRRERLGPALGPDRRHPKRRADHRGRGGGDGGRAVAGRMKRGISPQSHKGHKDRHQEGEMNERFARHELIEESNRLSTCRRRCGDRGPSLTWSGLAGVGLSGMPLPRASSA